MKRSKRRSQNRKLGPILQEFRLRLITVYTAIGFGVAFSAGLFATLLRELPDYRLFVIAAIPLALLTGAWFLYQRRYIFTPLRVQVCRDGVRCLEGNDVTAIPWDEIISINVTKTTARSATGSAGLTRMRGRLEFDIAIMGKEGAISLPPDRLDYFVDGEVERLIALLRVNAPDQFQMQDLSRMSL